MHQPLQRTSSFTMQCTNDDDDERPVKQKIVTVWCVLLSIAWLLTAGLCAFV